MSSQRRKDTCFAYSIRLPLRYEIPGEARTAGEGQSIHLSTESIRFAGDRLLRVGQKIRLTLAWPAALPDGTGLNLWVAGTVTRVALLDTEVQILRYEFRTRRNAPGARAPLAAPRLAQSVAASA